jgi:hypothetical protein
VADDRAFDGLLAYAAEIGAPHVVYRAHALPDHLSAEDRLLAETRWPVSPPGRIDSA